MSTASSPIYVLPIQPSSKTTSAAPTSIPLDTQRLWSSVPKNASDPSEASGAHVFYGVGPNSDHTIALSSLGKGFEKKKGNERREAIRKAVGSAVGKVKGVVAEKNEKPVEVTVDAQTDPHAAAVGAHLASYSFTLKTKPNPSLFDPRLSEPLPEKLSFKSLVQSKEWDEGVLYASAQNLARTLMELPANMLTPTKFTERIKKEFANVPNTTVIVRDEAWAAEKGMRTFLSVTKGSSEPAKFLEIHYHGAPTRDESPLVFVGKGITFDSGGISLKPGSGMKQMRADMGGAACVVSATLGIAKLGLPINLVTLTPLCENMPGPSANKPGDVVYAMNGTSVEIDNTDAEGRLVLSDALYYGSTEFKPKTLLDVATLTGAMETALGEIFTGVFTNSDSLWEDLYVAGQHEHDRFWRMPLDEEFGPQIYSSNADLCNVGGKPGGSCTAALFLKKFVKGVEPSEETGEPEVRWAHIDIAGTMEAMRSSPYQETGMTGRSTRALIEFAKRSL
ncbi:hypothetical protein QCA50_008790 [Cerrena zonata]|uniref:Cytosol aminopeptidase domain-containing protein n=1 Tax=Cerrena zonata TaxID=2478898 RepID=A0AAW0G7L3_9APHY